MTRNRTVRLGVLNIYTNPDHSPARYVSLFNRALQGRVKARYWGSRHAILASVWDVTSGTAAGAIEGRIETFVDFDVAARWVNIVNLEEASEEQAESAVRLTVRPESRTCRYLFLPHHHRLIFDAGAVGPSAMKRLIERLLNDEQVRVDDQDVVVTVEQEVASLKEIHAIPVLRRLSIRLHRPNAIADFEKHLRERLERTNIETFEQVFTAPRGDDVGLHPEEDEEIEAYELAALSYGHVRAEGLDIDGTPMQVASDDRPLTRHAAHNPEAESLADVLRRCASEIIATIIARLGGGGG